MSGYLRKATASQSVALGPFISSTDFLTPQTALTIANTDIKLVVNGGASANKNSGGSTHRVNGVYGVTFDATDSATVGEIEVSVVVAGALPVFDKFYVIEAAVFDALFATSAPGYLQPATPGRTLVVDAAGLADANTVKVGPSGSGTAQTARDMGASVLLSAGTGTGQLDFASGVVKSNLSQILGTALTETAGQLAAAFKKFFNIATPASTMDSLTLVATATNLTNAPTAGDLTATMKASVTTAATAATPTAAAVTGAVGSVTGAVGSVTGNVGGSVASVTGLTASDVGAIKTQTDKLAFTVANQIDANVIDWKGATAPAMTGDAFARLGAPAGLSVSADIAAVKSDTGTTLTDINTGAGAIYTRIGAPAGASVSADVAAVKSELDAVKAKTDVLPASPAATGDAMTLTSAYDVAKGTVAMTESYAAKGAAMTLVQCLHEMRALLAERSIAGTTLTGKKLDGATAAATYTLDDATNPSAQTRAT